jgi:peptidoglycan/LPS O-acetylase OafA/YrhL
MRLSDYCVGRDNNFNLIRVVAALAVLVTHSFALATGSRDAEPLDGTLGMTLGTIAVDVFFLTSGFLVTSSLLTRQRTGAYFWARMLRIYPALWVMLLLTVFVLGPALTSTPLSTYLASSKTYKYVLKCSTLIGGVAYNLPGVFEGNPFKGEVNGSLWTMPYEVRMYAILVLVWLVLRAAAEARLLVFRAVMVISSIAAGIGVIAGHFFFPPASLFLRLFFMFFTGAAFFVLRKHIRIDRWVLLPLIAGLAVTAAGNKDAFFVVYVVSIAYVLFYAAYVPAGFIRQYNRVGDYSYGIYIYAFPIQQTIAALIPGVSVSGMLVISAAATVLMATLSWHLLERRALALKARFVRPVGFREPFPRQNPAQRTTM